MKKWGPFLLIFIAGVLIGTAFGWWGYDYHRNNWQTSQRRYQMILKMFSSKLDLDQDQQQKLAKILEDKREKMEALRTQIRPQFQTLRQATREEIRQILKPEQVEKFNKMEERWDARRKRRDEAMH